MLVLGSLRLDSPRLDLLALVSVTLWTLRTVFRYSNKLARYDLLVKTFLTSKISHRNEGALKYISSEAGRQRAIRASLVYYWILNIIKQRGKGDPLKRRDMIEQCHDTINRMLKTETEVQVNVERSLKDLEELRMIKFDDKDTAHLVDISDPETTLDVMRNNWVEFYDDEDENDNDDSLNGFKSSGIDSRPARNNRTLEDEPDENSEDKGFLATGNKNDPQSIIDFDGERIRLRSLLEQSSTNLPQKRTDSDITYAWQQGLLAKQQCLQPAYEGPSSGSPLAKITHNSKKRWYF